MYSLSAHRPRAIHLPTYNNHHLKEPNMKTENPVPPEEFHPPELDDRWHTPESENKVISEFARWLANLRDCRLKEKAARLWRLFREGKLSGTDKAVVVAALLYCLVPTDCVPDILPMVGYLDDIMVVLGVMTYLDAKAD